MAQTILYIGNRLAVRGGAPTAVDVLSPLFKEEGFHVKTASSKKNNFLRLVEMLLLLVRNKKTADIVLIDTYSTSNFWYAYVVGKACRMLKLNYIPVLHGGALPQRLSKSPGATDDLFGKALCNVSPSPYLQKIFSENGFHVTYIPNSIKVKEYPFKMRDNFGPRLLWVRAFADIYNPMLAIKVLENLQVKYPDARLTMVGPDKDGLLNSCMEYAARNSLSVEFPGLLQKSKWHELAGECDIFLNTTHIDNAPISVIEAMALGLPVVTTDVGGIPFLIKDNEEGILVPPDNAPEMTRAIENLLQNTEFTQKMVTNARRKVEAFDWDVVKRLWMEVLNEEVCG